MVLTGSCSSVWRKLSHITAWSSLWWAAHVAGRALWFSSWWDSSALSGDLISTPSASASETGPSGTKKRGTCSWMFGSYLVSIYTMLATNQLWENIIRKLQIFIFLLLCRCWRMQRVSPSLYELQGSLSSAVWPEERTQWARHHKTLAL